MTPSVSQRQIQTTVLAPQLRQGLRLLAMGSEELRSEIVREMAENPVIDDVIDADGRSVAAAEADDAPAAGPEGEGSEVGDGAVDDLGVAYLEGVNRGTSDPEAAERRDRLFANRTSEESLEEHLLRQVAVSGIDERDYSLVETLIGEIDGDGYFRGSLRRIAEVSGESEEKLRELLRRISRLDPPGCGATTLGECLLPQLDTIRDEVLRERVRTLLRRLDDMAYVRRADREVLAAVRSLDPRPGRAFHRSAYEPASVRPEVRAVRRADGSYRAVVDDRDVPTIRISRRYLKLLEDPDADEETKVYVRERLAAVRALIEAVERRQETIASIAQAIFDAQPDFFRDGLTALRPLTMQEVADKVGVHHTTVSRTVRGKYVSTPRGTFELRQLFTTGVTTEGGGTASVEAVLERLRELVRQEDMAHPLSDEQLVRQLRAQGYAIARRTVAKYRGRLNIPSAAKRAVRPKA